MNMEEEYEQIWRTVFFQLSVSARRVLMAAMNTFVNPKFERFKKDIEHGKENLMCGFTAKLYSQMFDLELERAMQEIEQGCVELFDYTTEFTQIGMFEIKHKDRLISHYSITVRENTYLLTLTPLLASRANIVLKSLAFVESAGWNKDEGVSEESPTMDAEEPGEPSPKSSPPWDRSALQDKEFACEVSQWILTSFFTYALTPQERPENACPFPHLDPGLRRQLYQILGGFINGVKSGEISL